jgi:hypothetical protein
MSVALLLTVLGFAEAHAAASGHDEAQDRSRQEASPAAPKVGDADVSRLVEQLGDADFQVREAASRGLAALGETAVSALEAARDSEDPEVRRRAARLLVETRRRKFELVKRRVVAIKTSKLSPMEKGRRLKEIITKGMLETDVEDMLGKGLICYEGERADTRTVFHCSLYKDCGLRLFFVGENAQVVQRVAVVEISDKRPGRFEGPSRYLPDLE